jgi:ribosome biogenesis SPOUT family RNA methylase Rps3
VIAGTIYVENGVAILGAEHLVLSIALGGGMKIQVLAAFPKHGKSVVALELFDTEVTDAGGIVAGGIMSETARRMDPMDLSWMTNELQKYADDMGIEYTITGTEPTIQ